MLHNLIATGLGIGYIRRGGGTVASVVCCGGWYLVKLDPYSLLPAVVTLLLSVAGIWSATVVERQWGKDSYRVVIDEMAGMCLTLCFIPISAASLLAGLLLFRLFDIAKPLGIRQLEKLRGGWGVMFDDLLAGFYANLLLQGALILGFL